MDYKTLSYDAADAVAVITLQRPDVKNALSAQMRAEILHAIKRAEYEARVVVLTGGGDAFCSGQDLGEGASVASLDLERTLRDEYAPMLRAITECKIPTIAAVNGAAAGAGATLALAFDVVIAANSAYFTFAFSKIGLIPDAGGTYFLPRQVGLARAMGASLFADKISAEQAVSWGMIYELAEDDAFAAHWRARAHQLASGPTKTYRYIKQAMAQSFENKLDQQVILEAKLQGKCGKTRDFKEGVLAFLEKRTPDYEGR